MLACRSREACRSALPCASPSPLSLAPGPLGPAPPPCSSPEGPRLSRLPVSQSPCRSPFPPCPRLYLGCVARHRFVVGVAVPVIHTVKQRLPRVVLVPHPARLRRGFRLHHRLQFRHHTAVQDFGK